MEWEGNKPRRRKKKNLWTKDMTDVKDEASPDSARYGQWLRKCEGPAGQGARRVKESEWEMQRTGATGGGPTVV
jgi:hypothetical protein